MEKLKRLSALILASLLTLAFVGCGDSNNSADESVTSSVESVDFSDDVSYSGPAYEDVVLSEKETVSGGVALQKPHKEKTTTLSGTVQIPSTELTIKHESVFYGHDSAVNRDFGTYGFLFKTVILKKCPSIDGTFAAEFTGDNYEDFVLLKDGVLEIFPTVVQTNKTYSYNEKTYDSIYGNENSSYSFGDPITYSLGINAELRGTGDFDGNEYVDFLFVTDENTVVIGLSSENGIQLVETGKLNVSPSKLHCGDVNGDGFCDLIIIDGYNAISALNTNLSFKLGEAVEFPFKNEIIFVSTGDINNDRKADVILLEKHGEDTVYRSLFGRGDGFFGPRLDVESEGVLNMNLYGEWKTDVQYVKSFSVCDMNGDGIDDIISHARNGAFRNSYLGISSGPEAYDYSLFGFVADDGTYRLYSGGRWMDRSSAVYNNVNGEKTGDGDHVMLHTSKDGIVWERYLSGPMFYLGIEQGYSGWETPGENWWTGNTLEPEVVYVDGKYHMIIQSSGITKSGYHGDYIGYASSTDGVHFERKIDSPVIVPTKGKNFTQFEEVYGYEIGFNHHELVYIADDPDGKCFHLYTGHFINNMFCGYVRIRSADPTCFYWNERETATGIAQIGNQIGYISNFDGKGNRLYLRVTFDGYKDEDGERTVPVLQYSLDGLNFGFLEMNLASVDVTDPITENNRNVYFLGFCTLNGTGEIQKNEDGSYKLIYFATTANTPVAPEIFFAEAGLGVLNFTIE